MGRTSNNKIKWNDALKDHFEELKKEAGQQQPEL
jgi:hypothetical protein